MAHAIALQSAKTNLVRLPVDVLRGKLIIMMPKLEANIFSPMIKFDHLLSPYISDLVCAVYLCMSPLELQFHRIVATLGTPRTHQPTQTQRLSHSQYKNAIQVRILISY